MRLRELYKNLLLNDTTGIDYFYSSLKEDLKDLLVGKPRPTSFNAFAWLCTELDNRLHERELEKKESSKGFSLSRSNSKPRPRPAAYSAMHTATPAVALSSSQVVPMEIDIVKRGPLSAAEKDRHRREGPCLYCGQGKHMIADCPNVSAAAKAAFMVKQKASPSGKA